MIKDIEERALLLYNPINLNANNPEAYAWALCYRDDVQYLLSLVKKQREVMEKTEENLAKVVNKMCGGTVPQYIFEDARSVYYSIKEALKEE